MNRITCALFAQPELHPQCEVVGGRSRTQTRTLSDAAIVAALLVKGKCRPQRSSLNHAYGRLLSRRAYDAQTAALTTRSDAALANFDSGAMHGLRCAAYSLGFFAVGYALALPGATLPFLEAAASASERAIGLIFVFRGTCYTAASLAGGFIGDAPRLRGATRGAHAAMAAALGLAAAGLGCARRAFSPPLLGLALAAASLAMGALDTLGNVALLASARRAAPDRSANCEMGLAHAALSLIHI